jgi:hypothetical protein
LGDKKPAQATQLSLRACAVDAEYRGKTESCKEFFPPSLVIPSEAACQAVALCEGLEESHCSSKCLNFSHKILNRKRDVAG